MAASRQPASRRALRNDAITAALLALASVFLASVIAVSGIPSPVQPAHMPSWTPLVSGVLLAIPIAFRRQYPTVAGIAGAALYMSLAQFVGIEMYATQVMLFLSFYSIGAWEPRRNVAFWVRLAICIGMAAWLTFASLQALLNEPSQAGTIGMFAWLLIQICINVGYFGAGWVFGDRAWASALEREALEAAYAEIGTQQRQLADQAVDLERVRIARELHDVVAHHVSAMGIQAGAARRMLTRDTAMAEEALRHVEGSARSAIAELRTMVGALRSDGAGDGPMPTLADLDELLQQARASGQRVTCEHIGELPELSAAAELTAFRIVQEALTNARKHAGPTATATVRLRGIRDAVEVEVSDDGRGTPAGVPGTGLGLTGIRERVHAVGGTVEAAAKSGGGWLVRATLPAALRAPVALHDDDARLGDRPPRSGVPGIDAPGSSGLHAQHDSSFGEEAQTL